MRAGLRNSQMLFVIAFNVSRKKYITSRTASLSSLYHPGTSLFAVERFNVASICFESRKIHRMETQPRASLKVSNGSVDFCGKLSSFVTRKLSERYLDSQEPSWRAKSFFKVPRSNLSRSRMLF